MPLPLRKRRMVLGPVLVDFSGVVFKLRSLAMLVNQRFLQTLAHSDLVRVDWEEWVAYLGLVSLGVGVEGEAGRSRSTVVNRSLAIVLYLSDRVVSCVVQSWCALIPLVIMYDI
jgi:hypothetical protein